jgi:hypothetical protein
MNVTIQYYNDSTLRGFVGDLKIFDVEDVGWRKLDALGLPRLGRSSPWVQTDWGWEINVEFATTITATLPPAEEGNDDERR